MRPVAIALALGLAALAPGTARAAPRPLDRVVAVVDRSPILLSEVRARAKPILARMAADRGKPLGDGDVAAVHRELVDVMVDERLIAREAEERHLTVGPDEVDRALDSIAANAKVAR